MSSSWPAIPGSNKFGLFKTLPFLVRLYPAVLCVLLPGQARRFAGISVFTLCVEFIAITLWLVPALIVSLDFSPELIPSDLATF